MVTEVLPVRGGGKTKTNTGSRLPVLDSDGWWVPVRWTLIHIIVLAPHEPPRVYVKMWSSRVHSVRWGLSVAVNRQVDVQVEYLGSQTIYVISRLIYLLAVSHFAHQLISLYLIHSCVK